MNPINPQQLHEHSADRRRELSAGLAAERSRRAARAAAAPASRLGPLLRRLRRVASVAPAPVPTLATEVQP